MITGSSRSDRSKSSTVCCAAARRCLARNAKTPAPTAPAPSAPSATIFVMVLMTRRTATDVPDAPGHVFAVASRMAKNGSSAQAHVDKYPKPPYPPQKLEKPGIEGELEPKPQYEAPKYRAADKLKGKRALITGGDSGIGRAVAVLFAREGADIAINYLDEEQQDAEETKAAVEAEGRRCVLIPGDLTDEKFCAELVKRTVKELGGIEILVSN